MKYKVMAILLLLPILLTVIIFSSAAQIQLPTDTKIDRIVLDHSILEPVSIQDGLYEIRVHTVPVKATNANLVYSVSDEEIATIVTNDDGVFLKPNKAGKVRVTVSTDDGLSRQSFDAYVYSDEGRGAQEVLIFDSAQESQSLTDEFVYGQYDLVNDKKVNATYELSAIVLGTKNQNVKFSVIEGQASITSDRQVTVNGSEDIIVEVSSVENNAIKATYALDIVPEAVNVYSYEDLMYCTNLSDEGEKVVLRTNLESVANTYGEYTNYTEAIKREAYRNTAVFAPKDYDGKRKKMYFNTVEVESTYDTTFIDNLQKNNSPLAETFTKNLTVGVVIKDDFYGNGYTMNLHELCRPSETVNGYPIWNNFDLFTGPIPFISAMGMTVFGQDSIGTLIQGDDITLSNLVLKNCNNVSDLTYLEYVGTTLEIMGDNVTIKDCIISNGRSVIRSFSNENLTIDHCLVQYAREFILKVGSNQVLKPEEGKSRSELDLLSPKQLADFLSPVLPTDSEGKVMPEYSDSSLTISDTYFYNSGFFSIGVETHFAGRVLYDAPTYNYNYPEIHNMAGTSYATRVTVTGDTRIYDWKSIDSLDSSTLIKSDADDSGAGDIIGRVFDIKGMVRDYITDHPEFAIIEKDSNNTDVDYVHGGIAFYGGGKNYSTIEFESDYGLKEIPSLALNNTISLAAGSEPFRFNLYTNGTNPNYFGLVPMIETMRDMDRSMIQKGGR